METTISSIMPPNVASALGTDSSLTISDTIVVPDTVDAPALGSATCGWCQALGENHFHH